MTMKRRTLFGCSASLAVLLQAAPALAQNADTTIDEVVITAASRVQRSGFEAPTPTTVLGAELIEAQAITSVGQISKEIPSLNELNSPTAFTQTTTSVGATLFNLRGLGSGRTLVLVDGRRHVPTGTNVGLNVDVIPTALLEQVEVVTGGASADWGSDAVTGVVNLRLKRDLEGFSGTVQAGTSQRGDHQNYLTALAWGQRFADNRGRFMIAGEYYKNRGVRTHARRDWGREQWGLVTNPAYTATNGQYRLAIVPNFQSSSATQGGLILTGVARGTTFGPGGATAPLVTGQYFNPGSFTASATGSPSPGQSMSGGSGDTLGLFVPLELPVERFSVYSRTFFDITDNITAFAEASWVKSTGEAPTSFGVDHGVIFAAPLTVSVNNAFLPTALRNQMVAAGETSFKLGRYNTDFGFVEGKGTFETKRAVIGLEGDQAGWKWSAYYQVGKTEELARSLNNVLNARLTSALNSVVSNGQPVCAINADAVTTNDDAACAPLNPFGSGSPSAAALAYIHADAWRDLDIEQHVAAFDIAGDPFSTWAGPVSVAFGGDWRREEIKQVSDPNSRAGAFWLGQTATNLSGEISVIEGFAEAVVPLLKDAPLVQALDFNGAVRHSRYSFKGPVSIPTPGTIDRDTDVTTWKAGLTWDINDEFRVRYVRSRDIRAPNVNELFTVQNQSSSNIVWDGVATPVTTFRGGNPALEPEEGDTSILGVVYQPAWLEGLRVSVDAYEIEISGAIASAAGTAQQLATACAGGNQSICALFSFNAAGAPTALRTQNININKLKSKGVDFEVGYRTPLSRFADAWDGDVTMRLTGSYLDELSQTTTIGYTDRAGEVGNNNGLQGPTYLVNGSVTYDRGPLQVYVSGRYISKGAYDSQYNKNGVLDLADNTVPARFYVNTSAQYDLIDADGRRLQVFGAINNLFDKDPPVIPQNFQIPIQVGGRYDVLGRTFTAGVRFQY